MTSDTGDDNVEPTLTDPVRARLIAWAADALRTMPPAQVPSTLVPVAKFRREALVRRAGPALSAALAADEGFRRAVLSQLPSESAVLPQLRAGVVPATADSDQVAALLYLDRPDGWRGLLAALPAPVKAPPPADLTGEVERLKGVEARLRAELAAERSRRRAETQEQRQEASRRELALQTDLERSRQRVTELEREVRDLRQQAADLTGALADARSAARKQNQELQRQADARARQRQDQRHADAQHDSRIAMLLEVLAGSVRGLAAELDLPTGLGPPADGVAATGKAVDRSAVHSAAELEKLLGAPKCHVVIDGYNVSMALWSALPLADQRARLLRAVGAFQSRTRAEVTVVFDGSDAVAAPAAQRGVRVAFSDPGTTADDLIVQFLRAEPEGRPLLVCTDDEQLRRRVAGLGGRAVGVAVLRGALGPM